MLQTGFILLTVLLAILLFALASSVASKAFAVAERRTFRIKTAVLLFSWLAYISVFSACGIFTVASLPPRIPILLVFPTFAFMIYFFRSKKFKAFIAHTPPSWPIYIQSFRIVVELLILGMFLKGIFPKAATFEGYNFDIVMGLSAPVIGYVGFRKNAPNRLMVTLWNIAGFITLAAVVFVILSQAYFPHLWGVNESLVSKGGFAFPYTFLAGFLMPVAVFLHVYSLVKTKAAVK